MKPVLVIDNYDSFTYNLVHILRELWPIAPVVFRNDKITPEAASEYEKIVLSPGPGIPLEAGCMPEVVRRFSANKSILGVCLGHQCIGEVFGGKLTNLGQPVHGKGRISMVTDSSDRTFRGLPTKFLTGRYHSWVVDVQDFPSDLVVSAVDEDGFIMALRHRTFDVHGVQFHPESVMTEHGVQMIKNWLQLA